MRILRGVDQALKRRIYTLLKGQKWAPFSPNSCLALCQYFSTHGLVFRSQSLMMSEQALKERSDLGIRLQGPRAVVE